MLGIRVPPPSGIQNVQSSVRRIASSRGHLEPNEQRLDDQIYEIAQDRKRIKRSVHSGYADSKEPVAGQS